MFVCVVLIDDGSGEKKLKITKITVTKKLTKNVTATKNATPTKS